MYALIHSEGKLRPLRWKDTSKVTEPSLWTGTFARDASELLHLKLNPLGECAARGAAAVAGFGDLGATLLSVRSCSISEIKYACKSHQSPGVIVYTS
jgi:hypothetical protein